MPEVIKMRLFTAICFDKDVAAQLADDVFALSRNAESGNFTKTENFHLTLVFIGETANTAAVKKALDKVETAPFKIHIGGLGKFRRNGGDIYWRAVERCPELLETQRTLASGLKKAGFVIEEGSYKPHLTLGREVIMKSGFDQGKFSDELCVIEVPVKKISLMKSERVNGRLCYTEIYSKQL